MRTHPVKYLLVALLAVYGGGQEVAIASGGMDAGGGLLDGLFSSVRGALAEESRRRPPYPRGNNRRRAAAGSTATTADDLVRRSNLPGAGASTNAAAGAGVERMDGGDICTTKVAGGDMDSSPAASAVGYRHRLCEAEHVTIAAVLATRAGGSEARDDNENILHREIKVGCPSFDICYISRGWQFNSSIQACRMGTGRTFSKFSNAKLQSTLLLLCACGCRQQDIVHILL